MSRRCKPGQRARILVSKNKGKIVLVIGHHHPDQEWGGSKRWHPCIYPWRVISLSGPLKIVDAYTNEPLRDDPYLVIEDFELEPLDDDDDGLTRSTEKGKPKPVKKGIQKPAPATKSETVD